MACGMRVYGMASLSWHAMRIPPSYEPAPATAAVRVNPWLGLGLGLGLGLP